MSGTDCTAESILGGPAIVLVAPQLGENVGFAARAMLNCGLTDLRIVAPRDGWPNPAAATAAAGADVVLERAQLFDSTAEAVADLGHVYATTARRRDLVKPLVTPRQAAAEMREQAAAGESVGLLFGAERSGLGNEDVVLAEALVTVPLNPAFSSLNLGQAVLVMAYEWFQSGDETPERTRIETGEPLAPKEALVNLYRHLEQELLAAEFFGPFGRRESTFRALRTLIGRAEPTALEVRLLHGVVTALSGRRLGGKPRGLRREKPEP